MIPNRAHALEAIRVLLRYIGEDPEREGLRATPDRVLRAWSEDWGRGYRDVPLEDLVRTFDAADTGSEARYDAMVLVKDIAMHSCCEHHMALFSGAAHIAYIPGARGLIGLSKLARVVDHFSRRLQTQERITVQVAGFLSMHLAEHVAVIIEASHSCMSSRGVMQPNAKTVTSALRGDFRDDAATRSEFLKLVG